MVGKEIEYSSAKVWLLNRDSQTKKVAILYPITRVELNEIKNENELVVVRTFIVNEGKWREVI